MTHPWAGTLLAAIGAAPNMAIAQSYPATPVRIVVDLPPGGTNDILARLIGARLGDQMGQTFSVW